MRLIFTWDTLNIQNWMYQGGRTLCCTGHRGVDPAAECKLLHHWNWKRWCVLISRQNIRWFIYYREKLKKLKVRWGMRLVHRLHSYKNCENIQNINKVFKDAFPASEDSAPLLQRQDVDKISCIVSTNFSIRFAKNLTLPFSTRHSITSELRD